MTKTDNDIQIDLCNYSSCINSNLSSKNNVYTDGFETIDFESQINNLNITAKIDPEFTQKVIDEIHFEEFSSKESLDTTLKELSDLLDNAPDTVDPVEDENADFLTNIDLVESTNKDGCPTLDLEGTGVFDRLLATTIKSLEYLQNKGVIDKANMGDKFMQLYGINLQSAVQYSAQLKQIKLQQLQVNSQAMLAKMQALQIKAQLLEIPLQAQSLYLDGKLKEAQYGSSKLQAGLLYLQYKEATLKELLMKKQIDAADLANIKAREEILGLRVNIDKIAIEKEVETEKVKQAKLQSRIMTYQIQDEVADENGEKQPLKGMLKIQKDTAIEQKVSVRREAMFKVLQAALTAWSVSKSADPTIKSPDLAKAAAIDTMNYYFTKTYLDVTSAEQYLTYFGVGDTYSEYINLGNMTAEGGMATNVYANVLRPYFDSKIDAAVNKGVQSFVYDSAVKLVPYLDDTKTDTIKNLDNYARSAIIAQDSSNKTKFDYSLFLYKELIPVPPSYDPDSTIFSKANDNFIIKTPTAIFNDSTKEYTKKVLEPTETIKQDTLEKEASAIVNIKNNTSIAKMNDAKTKNMISFALNEYISPFAVFKDNK